tara:strand:- start:320 stop:586 length:267 start_codon:yes stop_codon:yes gene_type:complete
VSLELFVALAPNFGNELFFGGEVAVEGLNMIAGQASYVGYGCLFVTIDSEKLKRATRHFLSGRGLVDLYCDIQPTSFVNGLSDAARNI